MGSFLERLRPAVPEEHWLSGYGRAELRGGLKASLTVGVMVIPQGMAYAVIAGLPPLYGLYAVLVPPVVYAALGSSRQLSIGPIDVIMVIVASGVSGKYSSTGHRERGQIGEGYSDDPGRRFITRRRLARGLI